MTPLESSRKIGGFSRGPSRSRAKIAARSSLTARLDARGAPYENQVLAGSGCSAVACSAVAGASGAAAAGSAVAVPAAGVAGASTVFVVGSAVNAYLVRRALRVWEHFLARIPVVKTVYGAVRDMTRLLPSGDAHRAIL